MKIGTRLLDENRLSHKQYRALLAVGLVLFYFRLRHHKEGIDHPFYWLDPSFTITVYGEDIPRDMREPVRWALRIYRELLPYKWKDTRDPNVKTNKVESGASSGDNRPGRYDPWRMY